MTTIHNGSVVIFFVYFLQTLLTSVHRRRARMAARVAIRGPRLRVTVLSATKDYCAKQVSSPVTQFDDYTALTGHVVGVIWSNLAIFSSLKLVKFCHSRYQRMCVIAVSEWRPVP